MTVGLPSTCLLLYTTFHRHLVVYDTLDVNEFGLHLDYGHTERIEQPTKDKNMCLFIEATSGNELKRRGETSGILFTTSFLINIFSNHNFYFFSSPYF